MWVRVLELYRQWLPYLAMGMSTLTLLMACGLFLDGKHRDAVACGQRNAERQIHRANFTAQIEQTEGLPAEAFKTFEITKEQAISDLRVRRARLSPVGCPSDPLGWLY